MIRSNSNNNNGGTVTMNARPTMVKGGYHGTYSSSVGFIADNEEAFDHIEPRDNCNALLLGDINNDKSFNEFHHDDLMNYDHLVNIDDGQ